ncbi:MAG: NADH-quinone oxidoreductase subunit N [Planctomycetes bacterium]|nr:NADH-quinone oxidoreductase subunit N [Planctomycetota bacterium]
MPSVAIFPFLLPFLLVCAGGLACIGLEAFLNRATKHALLPWIGAAFLVAAGIAQALVGDPGQLGGILAMDTARSWLSLAIIASAMLGLCGLQQSLHRDQYPGGEPYALTLLASAGAMLMVMAIDTITLFLGLELASLCVYALVGLRRHRKESNEALFKYFVMGAVFSAIFLYGAALTYGATGSTHLGANVLAGRQQLFLLGQALICIGLLFKVGAVPFHFWSPDAYAGAPAAVTGFMGAVIKVGGFAALGAVWLNQVAVVSGQGGGVLALTDAVSVSVQAQRDLGRFNLVFLIVALLSLVLGNFSALRQNSARRLIAFSSIAHAGYMLLAFVLPSGTGQLQLTSLWFYLVGYAITTAGALAALAALSGREDAGDDLAGLAGQGRGQPFYGLVLTVFLVSIAGVPPTVGFLGKYLVFSELVGKSWTAIAVFAMVMAVVGAAYYFRLIIAVWSGARVEERRTGVPVLSSWTLAAAALVTVALIAAPGLMSRRPSMPTAVATK